MRRYISDDYEPMIEIGGVSISQGLIQDLKCVMGIDPYETLFEILHDKGSTITAAEFAVEMEQYEACCLDAKRALDV